MMQQKLATDGSVETAELTSLPIGDFIAVVAGFASFLPWYMAAEGAKAVSRTGLHYWSGIVTLVLGACVFVFALVVLVGGFINPRFRLIRSPGWVYGAAASILKF
jgi:hypothetical protein